MNSYLRMLAGIFIVLFFAVSAFAQFQSASWDTITADNRQDALTPQAIAENGYEQLHLTYMKARPLGGWDIYYRFYDMLSGISPEICVESTKVCDHPVIASIFGDDYSEVVVLYEADGEIWGCINSIPPGPWEFINISNSTDDDMSPTVAYGYNAPQGAWITYTNGEYKIRYARGEGDSIYLETIEESELGEFGSGAEPFIFTWDNLPHIFYRGVFGSSYRIYHAYKTEINGDWIIEIVDTPNADDFSATAVVDLLGDIHVAITGNEGWGMPSHIYYLKRNHEDGQWSTPQLATGQYSATSGSILTRPGNNVYIASCGLSGNIYNGNVYLSTSTGGGQFQTQLFASYGSVSQPVLSDIIGEYGVLMFDAPISGQSSDDAEIVYYGPSLYTSITEPQLPRTTQLKPCYPNPFNASTNISFDLDHPADVALDIFDIAGRKVQTLVDSRYDAGRYETIWQAGDIATGVYFYRLTIDGNAQTKKMVLLK